MTHFFYIGLKKSKLIYGIAIIIFSLILLGHKTTGMQYYEKTNFVTGLVTASALNVRSGPGTNYNIISQVYKNEYIRIFAKIGDWYVIQTEKDNVGVVNKEYVKPIYPSSTNEENTNNTINDAQESNQSVELTKDEKETIDLINEERKKAGLSVLNIDKEVQNIARVKAKDMVNNDYFSHNSPSYGSPFDMLKTYGVSYKLAGENIAGNSTNSGAVNAWMNSPGHKANILNEGYNYTGLAVVNSPKYGKVFVQLFIGK